MGDKTKKKKKTKKRKERKEKKRIEDYEMQFVSKGCNGNASANIFRSNVENCRPRGAMDLQRDNQPSVQIFPSRLEFF